MSGMCCSIETLKRYEQNPEKFSVASANGVRKPRKTCGKLNAPGEAQPQQQARGGTNYGISEVRVGNYYSPKGMRARYANSLFMKEIEQPQRMWIIAMHLD